MARHGARLALTDQDADGLDATAAAMQALGGTAVVEAGDVALAATHARRVERSLRRFGALHGPCNIAGVLGPGPIEAATAERVDRVMHVNCLGPLLAIQQAAPALLRRAAAPPSTCRRSAAW